SRPGVLKRSVPSLENGREKRQSGPERTGTGTTTTLRAEDLAAAEVPGGGTPHNCGTLTPPAWFGRLPSCAACTLQKEWLQLSRRIPCVSVSKETGRCSIQRRRSRLRSPRTRADSSSKSASRTFAPSGAIQLLTF